MNRAQVLAASEGISATQLDQEEALGSEDYQIDAAQAGEDW